jgi:hypothetical protein
MTNLEKIRYLAANLPELQGLKAVPAGLFLSYAFLKKPGDFTLDCLLVPGLIALYLLIHRYYQRTFGRVETTKEYRRNYYLLSIAVMVIVLGGILVEIYSPMPISMFAIAFALAMLWSHTWMVQQAGSRNLAIFPAGLVCIALVFLSAFLPLLGDEAIGKVGFLRSGENFVVVVVGILYALYGVFEHLFLVRSLAPSREVDQAESA